MNWLAKDKTGYHFDFYRLKNILKLYGYIDCLMIYILGTGVFFSWIGRADSQPDSDEHSVITIKVLADDRRSTQLKITIMNAKKRNYHHSFFRWFKEQQGT
jgi:tRNA A37 threonylcarbamoyladenosine biosynthesis protein TsaE